jgi:hypothetical protein
MSSLRRFTQLDPTTPLAIAPVEQVNLEALVEQTQALELVAAELDTHRQALMGLESIQVRLEAMGEATLSPRAAHAMHLAYQSAISGLERYHETLPALECFGVQDPAVMQSVSMESIGSAVRRSIDLVLNAIKRVGAMFARMLERIAPYTRALDMEHRQIELVLRGLAGAHPQVAEIPLGVRGTTISTEQAAVQQVGDLVRNLNELDHQYSVIAGTHQSNMQKLATLYSRSLQQPPTTAESVEAWKQELNAGMLQYGPGALSQSFRALKRVTDARFPATGTQAASPLPGQRSIIFVAPGAHEGTATLSQTLRHRIELTRLNPGVAKNYATVMMRTMTPGEMMEVWRLCGLLLRTVFQATAYGEQHRAQDLGAGIQKSARRLELEYQGPQGALAEGIAAGATISTWTTLPYVPLTTLSISVVGAALDTLRRHIATYHAAPSQTTV